MGLKQYEFMIASVYSVNMYKSIKIITMKEAVDFFSRGVTSSSKQTIRQYTDIFHFGMSPTLITFNRE